MHDMIACVLALSLTWIILLSDATTYDCEAVMGNCQRERLAGQ